MIEIDEDEDVNDEDGDDVLGEVVGELDSMEDGSLMAVAFMFEFAVAEVVLLNKADVEKPFDLIGAEVLTLLLLLLLLLGVQLIWFGEDEVVDGVDNADIDNADNEDKDDVNILEFGGVLLLSINWVAENLLCSAPPTAPPNFNEDKIWSADLDGLDDGDIDVTDIDLTGVILLFLIIWSDCWVM